MDQETSSFPRFVRIFTLPRTNPGGAFETENPMRPQRSAPLPALPLALLLPALLFLCLFPSRLPAENESYVGEVVSVADGDTVTVLTSDFERIKVRFYGLDCPENGQPYGGEAKKYLNGLLYGKRVEVEVLDVDRYSRYVGLVRLDGELVNALLIAGGHAWTYAAYCKEKDLCRNFKALEDKARAAKLGLWGDPAAVPPWEWRKSKRS
ncbi:MAG: thermonuclease family protein [Deltaproteobacteria bacterium]|nr:thermonuclease family protein [Deltaproteobacteria bacterium]